MSDDEQCQPQDYDAEVERLDPPPTKVCEQKNLKAVDNFRSVLKCIAKQAKVVNDLRAVFDGKKKSATKIRIAEKDLFHAIQKASKTRGKANFETFSVQLDYTTGTPELIKAVRGRAIYYDDGTLPKKSDGDKGVGYSSISSSSSVSEYAFQ